MFLNGYSLFLCRSCSCIGAKSVFIHRCINVYVLCKCVITIILRIFWICSWNCLTSDYTINTSFFFFFLVTFVLFLFSWVISSISNIDTSLNIERSFFSNAFVSCVSIDISLVLHFICSVIVFISSDTKLNLHYITRQ